MSLQSLTKILNIIYYRINFDTLSLKELKKNEEFKSNLIVTKDKVTFNEKTL